MTKAPLMTASIVILVIAATIVLSQTTPQTPQLSDTREAGPVMPKLATYLLFDGNCKDAMKFYESVFGGELIQTTVGLSPMKAMFPENMHARVLNANLKNAQVDISASDWLHPTESPIRGNTVCLYLRGGEPADLKALFAKLSEGANVTDPLRTEPFGLYGALNDRFGVRWMFHTEVTASVD